MVGLEKYMHNGKISCALQLQVSHKQTNIVLWGGGRSCVYAGNMIICRGKWLFVSFLYVLQRLLASIVDDKSAISVSHFKRAAFTVKIASNMRFLGYFREIYCSVNDAYAPSSMDHICFCSLDHATCGLGNKKQWCRVCWR